MVDVPAGALLVGGLGPTELGILVLVILLLFGAARIPKLARSVGEARREFRRADLDEDREEPVLTPCDAQNDGDS